MREEPVRAGRRAGGRSFGALLAVSLTLLSACGSSPRGRAPGPGSIPGDAAAPSAAASTTAPPPPAAAANDIRVLSVAGSAGVTGRDGVNRPLHLGEVLALDDTVITGGGTVTLGMGSASVMVHPQSRLAVLEAARDVGRVLLSAGRMSAALPEGGRGRLRINVPRGDATASTSGGRISALTDGRGLLAVASERGSATLSSAGHEVTIGSGQQSEARSGEAPSAAHVIPPTLFLKVGQPPRAQRESRVVLRGETLPGALVSSRGVRAAADRAGRFTIVVPLREGHNVLVVDAEDATGRTSKRRAGGVTVRRRAPKVKHHVRW